MPLGQDIEARHYTASYNDDRTLARRFLSWVSAMFYSIGYVTHHRP